MTRLLGTHRRIAHGSGNGGDANYGGSSPRSPSARQQFHHGRSQSSGYSLCSRQSLLILIFGVLTGYVLVPMFVLEVGFEDLIPTADNWYQEKKFNKVKVEDGLYAKVKYQAEKFPPHEELSWTNDNNNNPIPAYDVAMQSNNIRSLIPEDDNASADQITDSNQLVSHLLRGIERRGENKDNKDAAWVYSEREKRIMEDREVVESQSLPTSTTPYIMKTQKLPDHFRKKILVTGGAGFVGSHLVDKLMMEGHEVIVVDNFFTGQKKNIAHWLHHPNFSLIVHDVTEHIQLEVDQIYHLACPASPPHYQYNPVKTIKTSTMGTINMLGLAKRVKARMLLTSTSEIYGDPKEHPQKESYWGNVNTIGPRSCYDEGKRVAETMMYSYKNQNNVDVRVARIFNTFGPRMHPNDGRVVSNFIIQALQNKNMTIYGSGKQTRSFQYVSDLVNGLHKLMNGDYDMPVNLGNPDEYSVRQFAEYVQRLTNSDSQIIHLDKSTDDPTQRKPDISTAKLQLDWEPVVSVEHGLKLTIDYFQYVLNEAGEIIPTGPGAAKPQA